MFQTHFSTNIEVQDLSNSVNNSNTIMKSV